MCPSNAGLYADFRSGSGHGCGQPHPEESPRSYLLNCCISKRAEGSGTAPIKVDSEGGVQAKESKTRFIAPVISLMLASRAADNDAGRHHDAGGSGEPNVSGRTLGGGSGFGMLGAAVAQSSRYVGMAFGYYGLAWSIYSSVIARGGEVQFDKNAVMDIKFGTRAPLPDQNSTTQTPGRPRRSEHSAQSPGNLVAVRLSVGHLLLIPGACLLP